MGGLWILKSTKASLVFPLMVLALVGFRKVMDYFPNVFSQDDLFYLDNLMPSSNDKESDDSEDKSEPVSSYPVSEIKTMYIFYYCENRFHYIYNVFLSSDYKSLMKDKSMLRFYSQLKYQLEYALMIFGNQL